MGTCELVGASCSASSQQEPSHGSGVHMPGWRAALAPCVAWFTLGRCAWISSAASPLTRPCRIVVTDHSAFVLVRHAPCCLPPLPHLRELLCLCTRVTSSSCLPPCRPRASLLPHFFSCLLPSHRSMCTCPMPATAPPEPACPTSCGSWRQVICMALLLAASSWRRRALPACFTRCGSGMQGLPASAS